MFRRRFSFLAKGLGASLILTAIACGSIEGQPSRTPTPGVEDWKTLESPANGFRLRYPPDWETIDCLDLRDDHDTFGPELYICNLKPIGVRTDGLDDAFKVTITVETTSKYRPSAKDYLPEARDGDDGTQVEPSTATFAGRTWYVVQVRENASVNKGSGMVCDCVSRRYISDHAEREVFLYRADALTPADWDQYWSLAEAIIKSVEFFPPR